MGRPASDKRAKLIDAAAGAFHRRGIPRTSLADVARAAGIAPGNTFYYFPAKDDLARAVVDEWCARVSAVLDEIDEEPDPWRRLEALLERAGGNRAAYAATGCPIAALSRDLRQSGEGIGSDASRVYTMQRDWIEAQFASAGLPSAEAKARALFLLSGVQGSFLLGHAACDDRLIASGIDQLRQWLDNIRGEAARRPRS